MNRLISKLTIALQFASLVSFSSLSADSIKNNFDKLLEGNQRYVHSSTVCHDDWSAKRLAQSQGQAPFAVIVTCSDSRVPPEIIFDQALGDLFVIRIAGNVVDDFSIGSIEYGTSVLGANIILVLGHSNCGAVEGALKGLKFDNHIQEVLNAIKPALENDKAIENGKISKSTLEKAIKANVINVEKTLKNSKPVLAKLHEQGKISILGAYYDLSTGKVEFLDKP